MATSKALLASAVLVTVGLFAVATAIYNSAPKYVGAGGYRLDVHTGTVCLLENADREEPFEVQRQSQQPGGTACIQPMLDKNYPTSPKKAP
jgi:hypothetical protein